MHGYSIPLFAKSDEETPTTPDPVEVGTIAPDGTVTLHKEFVVEGKIVKEKKKDGGFWVGTEYDQLRPILTIRRLPADKPD